jgi:hypothetical protein
LFASRMTKPSEVFSTVHGGGRKRGMCIVATLEHP